MLNGSGTLELSNNAHDVFGCECQHWFRNHTGLGPVTAEIVNTAWPRDVQFRDSSSGKLDHVTMSSLLSSDSSCVALDYATMFGNF